MQDYSTFDKERIANAFRVFAEEECKGSSDIYYRLANKISEDQEVLMSAAMVKYGQPIPNSFLAAVHFLLLASQEYELARYYPSISGMTGLEVPYELFRGFCNENKDKIIQVIQNKIVQTNVISRCAYLAPVFSKLMSAHPDTPSAIIDIGTSAGLTLLWDKYEYHYDNGAVKGCSPVKVNAEIRNSRLPEFDLPDRHIRKIGLDQNIMDPTDPDDALWLKALIWPDQLERFKAFEEALKIEDLKTIEFIESRTVTDFEEVISSIPKEELLIIYCTHAMYQFPVEMREDFWQMLDGKGKSRDFYFLSVEGINALRDKYVTNNIVVELTTYESRAKRQTLMAETNGHGNWFIWKCSGNMR